ncbi:hypothetical protein YPPY63_2187, partial [Yersinia pestis PY-63]
MPIRANTRTNGQKYWLTQTLSWWVSKDSMASP